MVLMVLVDLGEFVVTLEELLAVDEQEESLVAVEAELLADDALELVDRELLRDQEPNKKRQKYNNEKLSGDKDDTRIDSQLAKGSGERV